MSRQITSGRRKPVGVSSSYIAVLFTIPRKTSLKARDFQRRNDQCVPTISISRRRLAAMKGKGWSNGMNGEEWGDDASRGRGWHSEGLFSFLRAASLESRINHARNPGLLSHPPSPSRPPPPSHDSNPSAPISPSFPQAAAFAAPASLPLSMALWLTTNFSSRLTFCTPLPALVHGAS